MLSAVPRAGSAPAATAAPLPVRPPNIANPPTIPAGPKAAKPPVTAAAPKAEAGAAATSPIGPAAAVQVPRRQSRCGPTGFRRNALAPVDAVRAAATASPVSRQIQFPTRCLVAHRAVRYRSRSHMGKRSWSRIALPTRAPPHESPSAAGGRVGYPRSNCGALPQRADRSRPIDSVAGEVILKNLERILETMGTVVVFDRALLQVLRSAAAARDTPARIQTYSDV